MTSHSFTKLLICAIFAFCPGSSPIWSNAYALPRGRSSSGASQRLVTTQKTRLRASSPVIIYSKKRGHQTIEHLNVTVSNVGLGIATHVDVSAQFPDGVTFALKGQRAIAAGQRCLYSLGGKKTVVTTGIPTIVMSCDSCVR
jgi:hypothetical protein